MQFKLLTLALFASFFATGFTAATYPGLTEAESATIELFVRCIAKIKLKQRSIPYEKYYTKHVSMIPSDFEQSDARDANHGLQ
ncbi:hypothetical protein AB4K20DRAFT_1952994 [Rhizopus microsporus]